MPTELCRAVVTGYGVVTHAGSGPEALWAALTDQGPCGRPWSPDGGEPRFFSAAIADDYSPHSRIPRNYVHFLDRGSAIALDAALQAVESAGLEAAGDSRRFAVADGLPYRAPGQATMFAPNGQLVARVLGARGPVMLAGGAEASGMAAIAAATRMIATGVADVVIAGAAQSLQRPLLEHLVAQSFAATAAARPFDEHHDGMLPGEGAAFIVIEAEENARARGATPLARIEGLAETFDPAVEPLAFTDASEVGRAQQAALAAAGYVQNQVDLLVSCADGRPAVDFAEGFGALRTFGRHAFFAGVTAPAGAVGNTLAASGPIAVVCALEALRRQSSFPIAGFETPEEGVDLAYVRQPQSEKIDCVLVTSIGLGGSAASLLLRGG